LTYIYPYVATILVSYIVIWLEDEVEVLLVVYFNAIAAYFYHVHLHLHMHWKLCRKDHDCTDTHRTLPEEGCDVKEDISLHSYAFLEINNIYMLLWIWSYTCGCDLYLKLFFNVVNTILTCLMSWENCIKSMLNQLVV
jgi:hypothetical protein